MVVLTDILDAVDCNTAESAAVGAAINQVRQVWSFIGPFWFVPMYEALGFAKAAGMMAGLMGFAAVLVVAMHVFGARWRGQRVVAPVPQQDQESQYFHTKDAIGEHIEPA